MTAFVANSLRKYRFFTTVLFVFVGTLFLFACEQPPSAFDILPELQVDRTEINFATDLDPEELVITNSGEGSLKWSIQGEPDWLVVDPTSGEVSKGSDVVTLRIDPTEATATMLSDTIIVIADIGGNIKVAVTAEVGEIASGLTVDRELLDLGYIDTRDKITLRNTAEMSVPYLARADSQWIEILEQDIEGEVPGNDKREITVRVLREGLNPGSHQGVVVITSGDNEAITVTIRFKVEAQPVIQFQDLQDQILDVGYQDKASFRVLNSGTGTLAWNAEETETSGDLDWLRFDRSYDDELIEGGADPVSIDVTIDRQRLTAGSYNGEIVIESNDSNNRERVTILVTMEVVVPDVVILLGPNDDEIVTTNRVEFTLRASNAYGDIEFSTRLNERPWTAWSPDSIAVYTNLEESSLLGERSVVGAKTRTLAGESTVVERRFYVDAVRGPAIRFSPQTLSAESNVETFIDVVLEEVESVLGTHLVLEFDADIIQIERLELGPFFTQSGADVGEFSTSDDGNNQLSVSLVALGGEEAGVSGTGRILRCYLLPLKAGEATIRIGTASQLRDVDNQDIPFDRLSATILIE